MRPVACKFDANQAVISMAARILTLACVVHQASSFAAPLSRPAGVVVDELMPLLDEGGTTRSRNKSPETIKQIDACLEELREAGRGAKVLDDPRLFGEYEIKCCARRPARRFDLPSIPRHRCDAFPFAGTSIAASTAAATAATTP